MGGKGCTVRLAICIPNYERPEKLKKLLLQIAQQIQEYGLSSEVEVCVSDDHSLNAPDEMIGEMQKRHPQMNVVYHRNETNRGMDYNFLKSVMISSGEYCWIIGNDDELEAGAIKTVLHCIRESEADILVSPFDVYDRDGAFLNAVRPLYADEDETLCFDTSDKEEYDALVSRVRTGDALFCFLSNVVFKKRRWIEHGDMFEDKMDSIFIQMYMNLQTMREGAIYCYFPEKIIKNYADPCVNETYKREYDILVGLNGVVDYFFDGRQCEKLKECIVDPRINGRMWGLPERSPMKRAVEAIGSVKNGYYQKYFIRQEEREGFFKGKNIILYGAGNLGRQALRELSCCQPKSLSVYDSDPLKWGRKIEEYQIKEAGKLEEEYRTKGSTVVVANNLSLVAIVDMLLGKGIQRIALIN